MNLTISRCALFLSLLPTITFADHPTLSLEDGSPGPVTTISGTTLPKGVFNSAVQGQFIFNDEISDADLQRYSLLDGHVHSIESLTSMSLNTAYGASDNFTVGLTLPYIWRNALRDAPHHHDEEPHGHSGHDHGGGEEPTVSSNDIDGAGDATLYGQVQFFRDEANHRHAALIGGLKAPTGRTDVRTPDGELFEVHHQPGSGSWDPLVGLAFTQQSGDWSFDVNGLYTAVTDGTNGANLGDIMNYNVAVSYRVMGGTSGNQKACIHGHHDPAAANVSESGHHHDLYGPIWDLILEANGDWRDKVVEGGEIDGNTGGNIIFLAAGSRLALSSGWTGTVSVGIPVVNGLNGIQSEPSLRLLLGISRSF